MYYRPLIIVCCLLLLSCGSKTPVRVAPAAGTVVAADSIPIAEDPLNESQFTVKVTATEASDSGEYDIEATWGYNIANGTIRLPKDLEHATPAIRRDTPAYNYMVGFFVEGDSTFHDYYSVAGERGAIKMKYVKTYYFQ